MSAATRPPFCVRTNATLPRLVAAVSLMVGCKSSDGHPPSAQKPDAHPETAVTESAAKSAASGPRSIPDTFPKLAGEYVSSKEHPRVYETQADLNDMAKRISVPGSYSAQSFARLATSVKTHLASKEDWDAAYSGCDIDIYLHTFSVEEAGGYANEKRSDQELTTALKVRPGAKPPGGVAPVAAQMALYGALAKAGASLPAGAPPPDQATAVAKRILLAWADHGFRDASGHLRQGLADYCEADGKPGTTVAALQLARGVVYSAQAQDLLQGIGVIHPDEEQRLSRFHGAMYEAIRTLSNEEFERSIGGKTPDETYNNQAACQLTALVATARLVDDRKKLEAALYGGDAASNVKLPWTKLFSYLVYGVNDQPLTRITPNSSDDPLKSRPAYTTNVVAPGEINDRYRNKVAENGIGYPMFALEWLYITAESLRTSGYRPYEYRGTHQQTIEMATQYYACYGKEAGFRSTVTAENAKSCPDYPQYIGKETGDGIEQNVVIGAYRFPVNATITALEPAAKAEFLHANIDTVYFGRWRE
jgi:hypothetical protein